MDHGTQVDLAVVGSGGAAMAAAIAASRAGRSVVLVERGILGGTCVNVGCVPSKTLLAAAGARHGALANPFPGVPTSAGSTDLASLVAQKDKLISLLRQAKYADVAAAYDVEVLPGHARFRDQDTLEVDGLELRASAYLVATGAEPAVPDLPGLDGVDYLTSTTAMELDDLPRSLVVIGGGYVGVEQAQLFAHLGSDVTLIGRLAPKAEPELTDRLRAVFAGDGITVIEEHAVGVEPTGTGVAVTTTSGRRVTGQRLLVATGRRARTDGLNLSAAGIEVDARGFIVVDANQRTTNHRVFGAGDVTGAPQYVYVAAAYDVEVRRGQARFADPDTLEVDGQVLRAGAYLVATGAEPAVPHLPGLDGVDYLTSTTAMELHDLPQSLVVIGGGYVGVEQAQLFAHLGSDVTLIGRLAPKAEPELVDRLRAVFAGDGITIIEEHAVSVEPTGTGAAVTTDRKSVV